MWNKTIKIVNGEVNQIISDSALSRIGQYSDLVGGKPFGDFLYAQNTTKLPEFKGAGVTMTNEDGSSRQFGLKYLKENGGVLWFSPESGNPYDPTAIKLIALGGCIGYMPRAYKLKNQIYFNPDNFIILGYEITGGGEGLSYGIVIDMAMLNDL